MLTFVLYSHVYEYHTHPAGQATGPWPWLPRRLQAGNCGYNLGIGLAMLQTVSLVIRPIYSSNAKRWDDLSTYRHFTILELDEDEVSEHFFFPPLSSDLLLGQGSGEVRQSQGPSVLLDLRKPQASDPTRQSWPNTLLANHWLRFFRFCFALM